MEHTVATHTNRRRLTPQVSTAADTPVGCSRHTGTETQRHARHAYPHTTQDAQRQLAHTVDVHKEAQKHAQARESQETQRRRQKHSTGRTAGLQAQTQRPTPTETQTLVYTTLVL